MAEVIRSFDEPINHSRGTIAAYDLNPAAKDVSWMSDAQLVTFIAVAVEAQLLQRVK